MINLIRNLEETKKQLEHINQKYERLTKTLPAILYEYVCIPKHRNKTKRQPKLPFSKSSAKVRK